MKSFVPGRIVSVFLVVLVIASSPVPTVGTSPDIPETEPQSAPLMPGRRVVRIADDRYSSHRVPPPPRADLSVQSATFEVRWNPAGCPANTKPWPQDAKDAFYYATGIWGSLLHSSETIVVIACWLPKTTYPVHNWIGATTAVTWHRDFTNAPMASTYYVAALANALAHRDLNDEDGWDADRDGEDADAEVDGWFNADREDWYFGTDGNPAPDELDFASLVLHELGHGLGFSGWAAVDTGDNACRTGTPGDGCIGPPSVPPMTYDRFTEDGAGTPLLSYANPSAELGNALTGQVGGVFFDGPEATAANGGPVKLYAPNPWNASSYSHLDEQTFNNTPNSLMTPIQSDGESEHHPGPVTLGMFRDMGWAAVNTAPTLSGLPDQVVAVGGSADNAIDLWDYASDAQSPVNLLNFSIANNPNPNAGVSIDNNRYIDIRPAADWSGETDVTIRVTDPGGMQDTDSFHVTIKEFSAIHLPLVLRGWTPQPSGWVTIMSEDFEGIFPGSGWVVVDENADSGRYYWGKRNCRSSGGSFSAWGVGAGDTTLSCGSDYPNDVFAWMVYGPFSLADATAAELTFDWWSDTEEGYDEFFFGASTDDYHYRGVHITGDHSSWTRGERFDLSAVPEFGNLLGEDRVWIGFSFESDPGVTAEGAYVDNVVLRKRVGAAVSRNEALASVQRVSQPNQAVESVRLRRNRDSNREDGSPR